jgi:glutamyl-tRNA reductase
MVLGENQILGQAKDAYSSACAMHTAGKVIHRLFHQAFRVGKMVRTDTEMGKGACSVSSAAVEMIKERLKNIDNPVILFVGINQMIALAADGLNKLEAGKFIFANRTESRAVAFGDKYGATGFSLDKLIDLMIEADVIFSCTGSSVPIITGDMIDAAMKSKTARKLLVMDLAVPRDVEIEKDYHSDISLYDLEDIKDFVHSQQAKREAAIPAAEEIIDRKMAEFIYWFEHVQQEPIYNGLGDAFEEIYRQELGTLIEGLPADKRNKFNRAGKKMINKLLNLKVKNNTVNE